MPWNFEEFLRILTFLGSNEGYIGGEVNIIKQIDKGH